MSSGALTAATASRSSCAFRAEARSEALALAMLGFLALASRCRALVVLAPAGLREDPSLLDLLVETAEGSLERLTFADDHFGHAVCQVTPFRSYKTMPAHPEGAPTGRSIRPPGRACR